MDLLLLRNATRSDHEATEATLPLMAESLTRAAYVDALVRLYRVIRGWDAWAQVHVPAGLAEVLEGRQRAELLAEDLRFFGHAVDEIAPLAFAASEANVTAAWFLGAMYVVEGSTLGGQYIAAHVEAHLQLQPGAGDAYFRGYGAETGSRWNSFKARLAELPDEAADEVIRGAHACFAFFRAALEASPAGTER